jgi:hypothetical protein
MKKKLKNFRKINSNCCNDYKAFAQKKNSNSLSIFYFTHVKIIHYTLYILYIIYIITYGDIILFIVIQWL